MSTFDESPLKSGDFFLSGKAKRYVAALRHDRVSHRHQLHRLQSRGTHTRWQLVANDGTSAPTLADMGASFGIAAGGVLTLFIAAPPNASSVWVRVVDELSGAVFEQEISADLSAATQFLSPRIFLNTGATATAVAYDCAGVYLETDY